MTIVSRATWKASADLGPLMRLPADHVQLHHTVTNVTKDPYADMRVVERIGVQRFGRLSYSWAVHPHLPPGTVLEGAGLSVGAHTGGMNSTTYGLVLIGNYEANRLPDPMVASAGWIIRHLVETSNLKPTWDLRPHSQFSSTACPGKHGRANLERIKEAARAVRTVNRPRLAPVSVSLPFLVEGDRSQHVASLQSQLNIKAGQRITTDGHFGPATKVAVTNVQRFFGLQVDGIVGGQTWATLLSIPSPA